LPSIPARRSLWGLVLWSGVSACPAPTYEVTTTPEDPQEEPHPDPSPEPGCEEATFGPEGGTLDRGEAVLSVPPGAVEQQTVLELCRTAPESGGYEPLSSGWQVALEAGTLRGSIGLTLRLADTESVALFVSDYGGPVRAILAEQAPGGELTARLYRPGVVTAAYDERVLLPYVPRPAAADVLLVVDNSCSNLDDQALLGSEISGLLERLQANGVDYHVGVVSTDYDDPSQQGQLVQVEGQRWVDPSTPGGAAVLDRMIELGNEGSLLEQGLATTLSALTVHAYGANAGFLRRDSALSIVVMSDRDDQGMTDPQSVVDVLRKEQELRPVVEFHSLVDVQTSSRYLEVTEQIGGVTGDIDGSGWDLFVARVADRLAAEAGMELPREKAPEVWLIPDDGQEPRLAPDASWGWHAERGLLWLTHAPPASFQLRVLALP
jgi:hypothetical protein